MNNQFYVGLFHSLSSSMKDEKKLSNNNNVSFKLISSNQKVENDKERIKSKFNFNISRTSTNSSVFKQSSLATQQNSCLFSEKLQKIKNKIIHQNHQKISYTNQKAKKSKKKLNSDISKKNSKEKEKDIDTKDIYTNNKYNQINENIISNITYNNYDKYYTDNSSIVTDSQKNNLLESILKTQTIEDGVNCSNSNDNIDNIENDCNITIKKKMKRGQAL